MKKMFFAIMVATSLMSASFANAQNEVKMAPSAQKSAQQVNKSAVKQNEKKAPTSAPTKTKTMTKTEKATNAK